MPPPNVTLSVKEFLAWPGDGGRAHLLATRSGCRVLIEPGVRPRAGAARNVRIPDLAVACPPMGQQILEDPLVLVEILSPGNAAETPEAVRACLTIASLREVLVTDSFAIRAEHLVRKADGLWLEDPAPLDVGDDIAFDSLGFRAPLAGLYVGTGVGA